jgi:putative ABC transport system permease protein
VNALIIHEVRSILASFRRRPLVPLVAMAMLALGIATNVAVFTVINRTLLRPLPYARPDRVLFVTSAFIGPDHKEENVPSGPVEIVQWRQRATQYAALEAVRPQWMTVRDTSDPESVSGGMVTGGIFRMFGIRPLRGRDFAREDDVPTARTAIITYGWWQRRFGGSASAIGRTVFIDGRPLSIIGVLPRDFEIAGVTPQPELFVPAGLSPANMPSPNARGYAVFGRLRDGVTSAQGESDLRRISAQLATEYAASNQHFTARVQTLRERAFGERRQALMVLWLTVALVHLLACVNVASLLSAQIADERSITALRLVLGAGRWNIIRYRLLESLLITAAGALTGFASGSAALRLLLLRQTNPELLTPVEHAWVMPVFLVAIAIVSAVVVAIVPALRETGTRLTSALNDQGSRSSSSLRGTRMRELFIVIEIALAVPLLLAATATVQRFRDLQRVDIGFKADHVLVSQIVMPPRYDKVKRAAFAHELIRRIEALPGVAVASVTQCNFSPAGPVSTTAACDRFPEPMAMNFRRLTPHYFDTMRIPLIAGRAFNDADVLDSPGVMIVSASLAKKFFGSSNAAIGQRILRTPPAPPATVIGVAPDVRDDGPNVEVRPTLYSSYLQANGIYLTLVVRTLGDPNGMRDAVRRAVWSLDRDITPSKEMPLEALMTEAVGSERLQVLLLTAFAFIALILAAVGIYGMTSYAVAKRMREIGVRLALGATPRDVIVEVVQRAVRTVAIGLAAGIALAFLAQRAASLVVYGAARFDPGTAAIAVAVLFAASLVAASVPSLRARAVQPALLLRDNA